MVVVKPGTKESDNVCGSPASLPSTSLASSDAEAGGETYEAPPTAHLPKGNVHSCFQPWDCIPASVTVVFRLLEVNLVSSADGAFAFLARTWLWTTSGCHCLC